MNPGCVRISVLATRCLRRSSLPQTVLLHCVLSEALRPFVKCGIFHCVGDSNLMTATGIPQHLAIVNRLHSIEASAQQARQDLLNKCAELPNQVTDAILSRLQVNGAVPVTAIDISKIIGDALSEFRAHLGTNNQ